MHYIKLLRSSRMLTPLLFGPPFSRGTVFRGA